MCVCIYIYIYIERERERERETDRQREWAKEVTQVSVSGIREVVSGNTRIYYK